MTPWSNVRDCFPGKWGAITFFAYMILFINQGILVTATKQEDSKYNYSIVIVVMLTECLKLLVCSSIYIKEFSFVKLVKASISDSKVLLLYFVPSFLYSIYNNLTFVNLSFFDPTTYYLLLQIRVVVTGIVFQVLFKKQLSRKQWMSLILLTIGCIVKQLHTSTTAAGMDKNNTDSSSHVHFHLFLLLVQVFCSCFAGVYNEYLLKDAGADVHLMLQNVFMYFDCIICNLVALLLNGEAFTAFSSQSLHSVFQPMIIAIIINNAACGIATSLFLRNLNSILKTFASALELVFIAVLCWFIFKIPIDMYTVVSIAIVSYATYLYSQSPVVNKGRLASEVIVDDTNGEDAEKLLSKEQLI